MKISDLVNKVEDFEFEFDGQVLKGKWWKYRTTTPAYAKQKLDSLPKVPEDGTEEEKNKAKQERAKAVEASGFKMVADMIMEWNAEDANGNPVPPSREIFEQLPAPFTERFLEFLKGLREQQNPPSNGLQST